MPGIRSVLFAILLLTSLNDLHSQSATTENKSAVRLKHLVDEYVRERIDEKVEKYTIEFIQVQALNTLPSDATVEIESSNSVSLRGRVTFMLQVTSGKEAEYANRQNRITVTALIRTNETALITTGMVPRHQEVTTAMARSEMVETTNLPGAPVRTFAELQGLRSKGIIPADRVLHLGLFERMPLVHRGDLVTIVVQMNEVTAKVAGKALEDGGLGEMIRAQNLNSKKVLSCLVDGRNSVRVPQ